MEEAAGVKPCWLEARERKDSLYCEIILSIHTYNYRHIQLSWKFCSLCNCQAEHLLYLHVYFSSCGTILVFLPYTPTPMKLHHKSLSEQQQQSFSIQGFWYSFPVYPCLRLPLSLQHLTACFTLKLCDAVCFRIVSSVHLLLSNTVFFSCFFTFFSVDLKIKHSEVNRQKHSVACTCVFPESCSVHFTCNYVETTAGKFTTTTVSFTYCITLGWIHMLHASSVASMSGDPCVPFYHITALWQVSHTSQVGW